MSENNQNVQILEIKSIYIIKRVFSYLKYIYFLKLIKYNKNLQKKLNIIFEDSIINYDYYIKTKKEEISFLEDMFEKNINLNELKKNRIF